MYIQYRENQIIQSGDTWFWWYKNSWSLHSSFCYGKLQSNHNTGIVQAVENAWNLLSFRVCPVKPKCRGQIPFLTSTALNVLTLSALCRRTDVKSVTVHRRHGWVYTPCGSVEWFDIVQQYAGRLLHANLPSWPHPKCFVLKWLLQWEKDIFIPLSHLFSSSRLIVWKQLAFRRVVSSCAVNLTHPWASSTSACQLLSGESNG